MKCPGAQSIVVLVLVGCLGASPSTDPEPSGSQSAGHEGWDDFSIQDEVIVNVQPPNFSAFQDNCFAVQAKETLHYRNLTADLTWDSSDPTVPELELVFWGPADSEPNRTNGASPLRLDLPQVQRGDAMPRVAFFVSAQPYGTSIPIQTTATLHLEFEHQDTTEFEVKTESSCNL